MILDAHDRKLAPLVRVALAVSLVHVAACDFSALRAKPDPTRFFVLAALPATAPAGAPIPSDVSIGLGPIDIPDFLRRPELVVRSSATEIEPSSFDHWGEPIERNVTRVLSLNLARLLEIDHVTPFPWYANQEPSFQVRIDFLALEIDREGGAVVKARWEIRRLGGGTMRLSRESAIVKSVDARDSASTVAALSDALADLSKEIAGSLRTIVLEPQPSHPAH